MSDNPKLLLIDGNNTCHKIYWAMKRSSQNLSYKGRAIEVVFGFFKLLIRLHKDYPEYLRIVAWDRGYARRLAESEEGVRQGLIPSAYKATRHENDDAEKKEELENLHAQMDEISEGLKLVRCMQVAVPGVEADDIINTYAKHYSKWNASFVIVSSDKDFFQLLEEGVALRRSEDDIWTKERFVAETGLQPSQWVDVGGLTGEKSDNIHGVDGWGPVTANKYIAEYGNLEALIEAVKCKSKLTKKEQKLMESVSRVRLAKSLKAMDFIDGLPKPRCSPKDEAALKSYFLEWGFASLLKDAERLV